nr:Uncharacterised protein [Escherichia coli]
MSFHFAFVNFNFNMNELNDLITKRIERCITLSDVDNTHTLICRVVEVKNRRPYIDLLIEKEMIIRKLCHFNFIDY